MAWAADMPKKKGPDYYISLKEKYEEFAKRNVLLPLSSLLEVTNTKTISLLTYIIIYIYIKTQRLISINRETMEETLKSLNIGDKMLAQSGALGHMSKMCPSKNTAPQPSQTAAMGTTEVSGKAPNDVWRKVARKGQKSSSPTPSSKRPHSSNNSR